MRNFVRAQTRSRLKKLQQELKRAAAKPKDPEAIHDLRVAIRRFAQCVRGFGQFFDPDHARKARRQLRKLMKHCGEVRNRDVVIHLLQEAGLAEAPAVARLEQQRLGAEKDLVCALSRWPRNRADEWKKRLKPDEHGEGHWDATGDAPGNAKLVLPALIRDLFAAGGEAAAPGAAYEAMHKFRLRAKRLRYTLEIFAPLYGVHAQDLERGLQHMKGLQDALGDINDCVTARELLGDDPQAIAAVEGLLPGREAKFRRYWKRHFNPAALRWWSAWLSEPESN